jgi:hypothetical protein
LVASTDTGIKVAEAPGTPSVCGVAALSTASKKVDQKQARVYLFYSKQNPSIGLGEAALPKPELRNKTSSCCKQSKTKAHPPGTIKPFIICVLCGGHTGINDHNSAVPALFSFNHKKKKKILKQNNTTETDPIRVQHSEQHYRMFLSTTPEL